MQIIIRGTRNQAQRDQVEATIARLSESERSTLAALVLANVKPLAANMLEEYGCPRRNLRFLWAIESPA